MMKLTTKFRIPAVALVVYSREGCACNTLALLSWENLPPCHDNAVQHLEAKVCSMSIRLEPARRKTYTWFVGR
jgi:hypothetical protein